MGFVVVFITVMTIWAVMKKRRIAPTVFSKIGDIQKSQGLGLQAAMETKESMLGISCVVLQRMDRKEPHYVFLEGVTPAKSLPYNTYI